MKLHLWGTEAIEGAGPTKEAIAQFLTDELDNRKLGEVYVPEEDGKDYTTLRIRVTVDLVDG